jgi:L-iditol 2-dehydrogenase
VRAIVLEAPRRVQLQEVVEPRLNDDDVLVRVERAGVCGSDLAVFEGKRAAEYPLIMGHEAVGTVTDPGDTQHAAGTRVVIEPNIPCGRCVICRRGRGNVCPAKRSLGMNSPGAFADYVAVPGDFVHPLPSEAGAEDTVGIEPLAVALHAFRTSCAQTGDEVAVIGCGAEGLLLVQVAVAHGARVLAVDVRAAPLEAAQRLGAEQTMLLDSRGDVDGASVASGSECCLPTVVFEAAGAPAGLLVALRLAAPGGRVVALGLGTTPVPLEPLDFVRRGLTLSGSLIYDHPTDFLSAIDLVREGRIRPSSLLTRTIDLDDLPNVLPGLGKSDMTGKMQVRLT